MLPWWTLNFHIVHTTWNWMAFTLKLIFNYVNNRYCQWNALKISWKYNLILPSSMDSRIRHQPLPLPSLNFLLFHIHKTVTTVSELEFVRNEKNSNLLRKILFFSNKILWPRMLWGTELYHLLTWLLNEAEAVVLQLQHHHFPVVGCSQFQSSHTDPLGFLKLDSDCHQLLFHKSVMIGHCWNYFQENYVFQNISIEIWLWKIFLFD